MKNLTTVFYDLIDNGYIYEIDEDGYNMSYGEYVAIQDYFYETIIEEINNEINYNTTKAELAMLLSEILNTADDDTLLYAGYTDYYIDYDTDTNTVETDNIDFDSIVSEIEYLGHEVE